MAGQIGLDPPTMALVPGGPPAQVVMMALIAVCMTVPYLPIICTDEACRPILWKQCQGGTCFLFDGILLMFGAEGVPGKSVACTASGSI